MKDKIESSFDLELMDCSTENQNDCYPDQTNSRPSSNWSKIRSSTHEMINDLDILIQYAVEAFNEQLDTSSPQHLTRKKQCTPTQRYMEYYVRFNELWVDEERKIYTSIEQKALALLDCFLNTSRDPNAFREHFENEMYEQIGMFDSFRSISFDSASVSSANRNRLFSRSSIESYPDDELDCDSKRKNNLEGSSMECSESETSQPRRKVYVYRGISI